MSSKEKLLASAQKNLDKGLLQKAIGDYQQVVEIDPRDMRHRQKLADLLSRAKMNAEAIPHYDAVAKNFSENGFYLKAIAVYKQMQKLDPARLETCQRLAELNIKQGLGGNALVEYRNLLALCEKKSLHDDAVGVLQKLSELEPGNPSWRVRLVEGNVRAGRKVKALEEAQAFVQLLLEQGQFDLLAKVIERFLQLFPQEQTLQIAFARLLLHRGEPSKAAQLLKSLIKQDADNPLLLDALALAYRTEGDFASERLTLKHMLKSAPDDHGLQERLLQSLLDGGDAVRALELLEGWGAGWIQVGRGSALEHWCEELSRVLPDEPRLEALSHLVVKVPVIDAEPVKEVELREIEEPAAVEPTVAPESAAVAVVPAVEESASIDAEEMSLDFLEGMGGLAGFAEDETAAAVSPVEEMPVATSEPEPVAVELPAEGVAGDLELELELDLSGVSDDFAAGTGEIEMSLDELSIGEGLELDTSAIEELPSLLSETIPDFAAETTGEEVPEYESILLGGASEGESLPAVDSQEGLELGDFSGALELESFTGQEEIEELEEIEVLEDLEEYDEGAELAASSDQEPSAAAVRDELRLAPAAEPVVDEAALLAAALASVDLPSTDEEPTEDLAAIAELAAEGGRGASEEFGVANLDLSELVEDVPPPPDLGAELEEAEFFLQQGLFDEAEQVCRKVLQLDPVYADALARLEEIERRRAEAATSPEPQGDFFDLAAEILDDGALKATEDLPGLEDLDRFRFDGVFSEFKKGIESQIDTDDTESHYNLGIAYKEMGLIDDAIAEFDKAMKAPARMVDCLTLKGICLAEKGAFEQAEEVFRSGIANPSVADQERISLHYEMGLLYEVWGRPQEALKCFSTVAVSDSVFRDVEAKVQTLRSQVGLVLPADESPATGKSGKNRVSYL